MAKSSAVAIRKEISDYEFLLNDSSIPKDERDYAAKEIIKLNAQIEKMGGGKPPAAAKEKPKPAPAPTPSKKSKKAKQEKKKKAKASSPPCEELEQQYEHQRAASKKSKAKPAFEKSVGKVESSVVGAIKSIPAADIKENPQKYIKKFEALNSSMNTFLNDFESVVSDEFDRKEVKESVSNVQKIIENIRKKYGI